MPTLASIKANQQAIGNWGNVMQLRPYQQDAVDSAIAWMRKSTEPALLGLSTGAGKSHIAAAIALWITQRLRFSYAEKMRTLDQ